MPLAFTPYPQDNQVYGAERVRRGTVTFDNSYPTGGESYTPQLFGLTRITKVDVAALNVAGNRLVVNDRTNSKLLLFTALGTQATNASDQSTIVVEVEVTGY